MPGQMINDLIKMAQAGPPQLGARAAPPGSDVMAEDVFRREHGGMSRADWDERERVLAREAWEAEHLADVEDPPPPISAPSGLSERRAQYWRWSVWMRHECDHLAALEARHATLRGMIDGPQETEGAISALVRRASDLLMKGESVAESDAARRAELESKRVAQQHSADAARAALPTVEREIETARLRVARLGERENEFVEPVLDELAEPARQLLARKRQEVIALERLLSPLGRFADEAPRVDVKWRWSWSEIRKALQADPSRDISKMLPTLKF